ncbi:MAG: hypothetical protein A2700_00885 [Candidatus Blackburnbacteria bacterium RIFCSPHIGHO2_01_FULL_44_64]|uniref:Uncharacterized protein n=1 Tax=Candidatus Blackburnbacteria bacterium RIFCSPHIGHO2_02_FULL_44_20 TaxID=1797516 RepID=A0A1G1V6G3_9BACT|nr:MAG: hypothetical protein A2700_00885 [Candidatus Blackburnbacteria bacterium RIFCSPHIGHO2_01_FULL_44_64]OGY10875.1 MAG: hypothetical protein A3E16_03120 [Candidatus Blackburnbacteria bacterium RIFCSPHIGHO2_12_FULL_44_25]OGY10901.1 MAG: hypothetical protein A3D26_01690 [Candidatus Blackburnbacteria bacterium RIFCSPHIGHO2_02_FULL_44_20]OGY13805.1 MAG: hypothetical protein A3A62_00600 [Candidatus Blackburnbacteria bacterium RIFCSPLOWO2_01_FULL_44_43]OGY15905.1 MAG: hypothetical protein A3H88_0
MAESGSKRFGTTLLPQKVFLKILWLVVYHFGIEKASVGKTLERLVCLAERDGKQRPWWAGFLSGN